MRNPQNPIELAHWYKKNGYAKGTSVVSFVSENTSVINGKNMMCFQIYHSDEDEQLASVYLHPKEVRLLRNQLTRFLKTYDV